MTDLVIEIDTASPVPAFEQIRGQLSDMIFAGVLRAGDQLPPLRQLAADLDLAVGTTAKAYRALEVEGLIRSRRGGGTKVVDIGSALTPTDRQRTLRGHAETFVGSARRLGFNDGEIDKIVKQVLQQQR